MVLVAVACGLAGAIGAVVFRFTVLRAVDLRTVFFAAGLRKDLRAVVLRTALRAVDLRTVFFLAAMVNPPFLR